MAMLTEEAEMLIEPCEDAEMVVESDENLELLTISAESQIAPKNATRRSLIASVAALGSCGVIAAVLSAVFAPKPKTSYKGLVSYDSAEDENLVLSEDDTVRPERAVPQGELATITAGGGSGDCMGITEFTGTIRLRVIDSWLYETGEAFERAEGIDIEYNYADMIIMEGAEKERAYDEAHPEQAEKERTQRQRERAKEEGLHPVTQERVDDLMVDIERRRNMLYADDWSIVVYAVTTQVLLDAGYKLLVFDLEYENVNAQTNADSKTKSLDLLMMPSLARGNDVAVYEPRFYLIEGETEPTAETMAEAGSTFGRVLVPQGEKRRFHMVYAVSPRSQKGELSLFIGEPLWQPTIPENVVLLALNPEVVT